MSIGDDGRGQAYDFDDSPSRYEISKDYENAETPGGATPRESK